MREDGTGAAVFVADRKELMDAPSYPGRSLAEKLGFEFSAKDEQASLDNLGAWSAEQLKHSIRQRRNKLYQLQDQFPEPNEYQLRRMESIRAQIRRAEQVLGEREARAPAESGAGRPPVIAINQAAEGATAIPIDPIEREKAARKKLRDDYVAECDAAGVKVTNEMIGKAARPTTKNAQNVVQEWLSCDSRYQANDRRIRKVFAEKPHLRAIRPPDARNA